MSSGVLVLLNEETVVTRTEESSTAEFMDMWEEMGVGKIDQERRLMEFRAKLQGFFSDSAQECATERDNLKLQIAKVQAGMTATIAALCLTEVSLPDLSGLNLRAQLAEGKKTAEEMQEKKRVQLAKFMPVKTEIFSLRETMAMAHEVGCAPWVQGVASSRRS